MAPISDHDRLHNWELNHRRGPWHGLDDVEFPSDATYRRCDVDPYAKVGICHSAPRGGRPV
jgi:hypothetical protein